MNAKKRRQVLNTKNRALTLGLLVVGGLVVVFLVAYQKARIESVLSSGDKITAEFTRQYKVVPYQTKVKLAELPIGEVTSVDVANDGGALITMRVDPGVKEKLGGLPSAAIRPTLVVGGIYYIELTPGGRGGVFDGHMPVGRTTVPVELDGVLSAINPPAQKGLQGTVRNFDNTLQAGGKQAIRDFLHTAPPAFRPAADVLTAFRGTDPDQDLPQLVSGLEGFSASFNRTPGQFGSILDNLDTTTAALNAEAQPIGTFVGTLPSTLRNTRVGLADLQGSLDRLTDTAPKFRDSAQALDPLLEKLGPVVHRARPVVSDLKDVLDDAEPLVRHLTPVADKGTEMFDDIHGPVLDRVNGPVKDAVLHPWHGSGVYANGGNDHPMYAEIAYLFSVFDGTWMGHDQNGAYGRLAAGEDGQAATGGSQFPRTFEELLESNGQHTKPLGPQDSNQNRDKGLSGVGIERPLNKGSVERVPAPGPAPGNSGGDPLMMPLGGGSK